MRFGGQALGLLLAGLILLVSAASSCNSLHEKLHAAASGGDSDCLVCLFLQGQVDSPETSALFAVFIFCLVFLLSAPKSILHPSLDCRLSPSRAPPAGFSPVVG